MNNDDFRKLLATPRAERFGGETPAAGRSGQAQAKPKPTGEYRPKPKPGFKKPADKKKEDEEDEGPKYRDRAEERRRGKNADYEDASAVLSALGGGGAGAGSGPDIGQVDLSKLSEEETKYLGGDMRFTHLVKGLDYALLHKTRSEITVKKGDGDEGDEGEEGEGDGMRKEASRDAAAKAAAKANAAAGRKEEVRFVTPLARSVFSTLFAPPRAGHNATREMYAPRRTAFVYDFDNEDSLDTDVPTTLRRPKSECPQVAETLFAAVDNAVLERIAKIMSYVRTTADGKKLKKKDRDAMLGIKSEADAAEADAAAQKGAAGAAPAGAAAAAPAKPTAPVDDDEDIFGDAGTDYKPTTNKGAKAKDAAAPARRPDGSYFDTQDSMDDIALPGTRLKRPGGDQGTADAGGGGGGDDMDLEEGEAAAPAPGPQPAGQHGYGGQASYPQAQQGYDAYGNPVYGGQYGAGGAYGQEQQQQAPNAYGTAEEPRWRAQRSRDAKVKAVLGEGDGDDDDAYAEYYPGMGGYVGALADSDDEGDKGLTADMDSKTANKSKTRADFATDEEYARYKDSREHNPKAAYQYGVKRADGRKSGKELEKSAKVEAKQRDQKLDGQLRKIKGIMEEKGLDHGSAFDRKPKEDRERGGGGGSGAEPPTPAHGRKRLRI